MSSVEQITLTVDGKEVTVDKGTSILEACKSAGVEIPHFCYHKRLSVAGNCRMCLVEVEKAPKPVASCATPVGAGMNVLTQSQKTIDARKGVMEFLLINHPLDCPICDQGGECDLQDIALGYGSDRSRYHEEKRAVHDKNIGPLVKTVMTRCIHCTRCIRFATEVAGVPEMGATGRGEHMEVGTYVEQALESELSGNMIDLCPVGALTSKPYAYTARPWELGRVQSIDVMDALGCPITIEHRQGRVMRITPIENEAINEEWIADTARFSYDGLVRQRLVAPMVRDGKTLSGTSWPEAFDAVAKAVKKAKPTAIAALAGDLHSVEDLFAFKAFVTQTLGSDNLDARTDGMTLIGGNRGAYIMNSGIAGLDQADALLLIGCDPRFEAPVLNARIRKNVRKRKLPVASIGAPVDLTYPVIDLGSNLGAIEKLMTGKGAFGEILKKAEKPMIIVGSAAASRADGPQVLSLVNMLVEKFGIVRKEWNGYNMLHRHAGRVAALDLAVYPAGKGMDTRAITKACAAGKVDVLFVYGDGSLTLKDVQGAKTIVYIGTHMTDLADVADVVLPVATYTEKDAWWVNTEGRVQAGHKAVMPPLNAKEDWKVFRALSEHLGKALPFDTQGQLRAAIVAAQPLYADLDVLTVPKWVGMGAKGACLDAPLERPVQQFYRTNEVLRASAVMVECQDLAEQRRAEKEQLKKAG